MDSYNHLNLSCGSILAGVKLAADLISVISRTAPTNLSILRHRGDQKADRGFSLLALGGIPLLAIAVTIERKRTWAKGWSWHGVYGVPEAWSFSLSNSWRHSGCGYEGSLSSRGRCLPFQSFPSCFFQPTYTTMRGSHVELRDSNDPISSASASLPCQVLLWFHRLIRVLNRGGDMVVPFCVDEDICRSIRVLWSCFISMPYASARAVLHVPKLILVILNTGGNPDV